MIQRIQSVYLFIATIALGVMFFFPLMGYYGDLHTYQFNLLEMHNQVPDTIRVFDTLFTIPLLATIVIVIILAFSSIFLFKNRRLQLKLIRIDILLNLISIIAIFVGYSRYIQSVIEVEEQFKTGAFLPLISLVFLVLAYRAVKRDDELIRSADRLR